MRTKKKNIPQDLDEDKTNDNGNQEGEDEVQEVLVVLERKAIIGKGEQGIA